MYLETLVTRGSHAIPIETPNWPSVMLQETPRNDSSRTLLGHTPLYLKSLQNPSFISWVELYPHTLSINGSLNANFSNLIRSWLFVWTIKALPSNSLLKLPITLPLFLPALSTQLPSFTLHPPHPHRNIHTRIMYICLSLCIYHPVWWYSFG